MKPRKEKVVLEDLTSISENQVKTLKQNKVRTIFDLAQKSIMEIKVILDTTVSRASAINKEARNTLPPFKIVNANMILKTERERGYISTNNLALDSLLGGKGVEEGSITEFYSCFGAGKTQTVMSTIASCLLATEKYPQGRYAIILDTEDTFNPDRLTQILEYYKDHWPKDENGEPVSVEKMLVKVIVAKPKDVTEQRLIVKEFIQQECTGHYKFMGETLQNTPLGLLVVDSLTALFRSHYIGLGSLAQKQQKLNNHLRDIAIFSDTTACAVIVTNQVMDCPDLFMSKVEQAVGGHVVAHSTKYRVFFGRYWTVIICKS